MLDIQNSKPKGEIDLTDLFLTLWAYKLFIACTCALGLILGGYYAQNADKEYTSNAIFKFNQEKSSGGLSIVGELGALASLAGVSDGLTASILPTDRVTGRIFIEKLDKKLDFKTDTYFNTYNVNSVDPVWKSFIKHIIGWQKSPSENHEIIWQAIIKKYKKSVKLSSTDDGSIKITVTHRNPQRAAQIANVIMDEIITSTINKNEMDLDQQLSYLSATLAEALADLELTQSNLKEFTLENSALPVESFAAGTMQLNTLRAKLAKANELFEAVAALSFMLQNKTTDQKNYFELRQQFPVVDKVEFRRILGQNEIISSWSWPDVNSVKVVFDTLSQRINRLKSQINTTQIDAERSGLLLENYAKLERKSRVAEATYTVLIEQVKAQSLSSGYRPDNTEIYEYASPAIIPSAPKFTLILVLGALLGLLLGALLAFILATRRRVYFTKKSLIAGAQTRLTSSIRTLLPVRNRSLNDISKMLIKKPLSILRDIAVDVYKSGATQIVVTSSNARLTSNDVARVLASYMQSDTTKIAIIDFSSPSKNLNTDEEKRSVGSFITAESAGNVSVLRPDGNLAAMELLSKKDFLENTQSLSSTFDLVFLCADNSDAISLLSALEGQNTFHITLARTKKTNSTALLQMRSLLPIQGLIYE